MEQLDLFKSSMAEQVVVLPILQEQTFAFSEDGQPYWVMCRKCKSTHNIALRKNYKAKSNASTLCPDCSSPVYYDLIKRKEIDPNKYDC